MSGAAQTGSMFMKRMVIGLSLLACLSATGCYRTEQQRAQNYENFLKQTLGVAGHVDAADRHAQAPSVPATKLD